MYKYFVNCFKNLVKEVKDSHKFLFFNSTNQIRKDENQLVDISNLIKFMSNKFDPFEKERQEQEKVVEELRGEVFTLNEKLDCITEQLN